jgi:hypothetical protein
MVPWSDAPDCPVCHPTLSGTPGPYNSELFTFGFLGRLSAIIHRTVRCAIGLSGVPSDCPVCHQTVRCDSGATALRRNGRLHSVPDSATVRGRSQNRGQRRTGQ